jgi:hypothetical protein
MPPKADIYPLICETCTAHAAAIFAEQRKRR